MEDYMTSRNLKLGVFSTKDGALVSSLDVCGDADDLFVDPKRHRVYVSCGDGFLDVLDAEGGRIRAHRAHSDSFRSAYIALRPRAGPAAARREGGSRSAREHLGVSSNTLNPTV
jgi:hypothetical protein